VISLLAGFVSKTAYMNTTDEIFLVTGSLWRPLDPKVQVVESPL